MSASCSGCGSRLADDAKVCDLCGTPVEGVLDNDLLNTASREDVVAEAPVSSEVPSDRSGETDSGVHCNQCGWRNPAGARFCSQCGAALQVIGVAPKQASTTSEKPAKKDGVKKPGKPHDSSPKKPSAPQDTGGVESGAGRRMGIIVGASLLFVVAIFFMFNMGGQEQTLPAVTAGGVPAEPPLAPEFSSREAVLRQEMAGLSGEDRVNKQRELLTLYFTSGRFDLAGAQAEQIGIATGAESAWIDAGNFYYDWMESSDPANKAYYSRKATSAYQKALEINPDNLDVRTDMAVAYLYDPENSMLAIQETAVVLEADSNHVQANFNRGIMLWQINRLEEAVAQFERVLVLDKDPESPLHQRASEALLSLK